MNPQDMLSDEELLRYSRQILLQQIDIDGQLRLKHSRALIIGLGGSRLAGGAVSGGGRRR